VTDSNATNVTATARTILRHVASESIGVIAAHGYRGGLPPGLNDAGEAELRAAIQDEAKRLAVSPTLSADIRAELGECP
jgi:hypothetical protein